MERPNGRFCTSLVALDVPGLVHRYSEKRLSRAATTMRISLHRFLFSRRG